MIQLDLGDGVQHLRGVGDVAGQGKVFHGLMGLLALQLGQVVKRRHGFIIHQGGGAAGAQAVRVGLAEVHHVNVGLVVGELAAYLGVGPVRALLF